MGHVIEDEAAPGATRPELNGAPDAEISPSGQEDGATWMAGSWRYSGKRSWLTVRTRAALAVTSVLLALLGGWIIEAARSRGDATPPLLGWILLGLGTVAFVVAASPALAVPVSEPPSIPRAAEAMPESKRRLFNRLRLLALACGVGTLALFLPLSRDFENPQVAGNPLINTGPWVLYIASLLLFAGAFVVWERNVPGAPVAAQKLSRGLPVRLEWLSVGALTLAALLVRVWGLGSVPPGLWFDEAQNGAVGRALLAPGGIHTPFLSAYTQMGALYFYLVGIVDKLFGAGEWQVRLLPALFGTLTVPLLYLLASRLYAWRVGLAAAGLLAVSTWSITFSRYGMASMFTVALDLGVYLLVLRGLRTGRLGYYAGAGVMLGLAFQAYYIGRLAPVVLVALLAHLYLTNRKQLKSVLRSGAVVFVLGAVLGAMPVITFAVEHPEIYNGRVANVSVFSAEGSDGRQDALQGNLVSHLLMFNWQGDENGRHNLPGAPELDWVVASLFWVGLGSCVLRARRWHYFFPVVWFGVSLFGGVFSVVWEAPHAHRTLENSVVTCLLAGIFFGEALRVAGAALGGMRLAWGRLRSGFTIWGDMSGTVSWFGIAILVVGAASLDLPRYFVTQANDSKVWLQTQVPDLQATRDVTAYSSSRTMYLDGEYGTLQPYDYLGVDLSRVKMWEGPSTLPLTDTEDVALALDPSNSQDPGLFTAMYPNATLKPLYAPNDAHPLMYTVLIPASDLVAAHGVRITRAGVSELRSDFRSARSAGEAAGVTIETTIKVTEYGSYAFRWDEIAGSDARLSLDGVNITNGGEATLGVGLHSLSFDTGKRLNLDSFEWRTPNGTWARLPAERLFDPRRVVPHGLTGVYRSGGEVSGAVGTERIDPVLSFNSENFPLKVPYTVEWIGRLNAPSEGQYALGLRQIGRSSLYVDGKKVLDNTTDWKLTGYREASLYLSKGWHDIRIDFNPGVEILRMYFEWTPPGGQHSIVPSADLSPAKVQP